MKVRHAEHSAHQAKDRGISRASPSARTSPPTLLQKRGEPDDFRLRISGAPSFLERGSGGEGTGDQRLSLHDQRLQQVAQEIYDLGPKRMLDLGCGGGFMSEAMARAGARVTGVDPAAHAIAAAEAHARQEGLAIDYRVGSGERVPPDDESGDCVVCVDVRELSRMHT